VEPNADVFVAAGPPNAVVEPNAGVVELAPNPVVEEGCM